MGAMIRRHALVPLALFLAIVCSLNAQQQSIHAEILQVYSFQPHTLTDEQMKQKSASLDAFWEKAKSNPSVYVGGLQKELADFSNPPFFFFDGSMLLLTLSDTGENQKIALAALPHCDLRDVQHKDYFYQVHRLAALGENTTQAAFHVLDDPKFQVFIPEHFLTLGQNYVLIYLLLPTDEEFWVQPAVDRLKIEKDEVALKSLLLLLWYCQTDAGDRAISSVAGSADSPAEVVSYAKELQKRKSSIIGHARAVTAGEASIRLKRRERMKAVSDEALYDLDKYTEELIAKRK